MAAFTLRRMYVRSGSTVGQVWTPGVASTRITSTANSDERQDEVSQNYLLYGLNNVLAVLAGGDAPMNTATPTIGTTVTMATPTQFIAINGVIGTIAAETAKVFGSLGTIPTATWGLIAVERIANATTSFLSAADNYTTGYATEELAIAALPAQSADKAMTGFITILATTPGWVAGTDALAGGTGGTPATTTNYYGIIGAADVTTGPWAAVLQTGDKAGTVITSTVG